MRANSLKSEISNIFKCSVKLKQKPVSSIDIPLNTYECSGVNESGNKYTYRYSEFKDYNKDDVEKDLLKRTSSLNRNNSTNLNNIIYNGIKTQELLKTIIYSDIDSLIIFSNIYKIASKNICDKSDKTCCDAKKSIRELLMHIKKNNLLPNLFGYNYYTNCFIFSDKYKQHITLSNIIYVYNILPLKYRM